MPWAKPGLPELLCFRFFIYFFFLISLDLIWNVFRTSSLLCGFHGTEAKFASLWHLWACFFLKVAIAFDLLLLVFLGLMKSWVQISIVGGRQPAQGDGERGTHQLKKTSREFQTWDGFLGFLAGSQGTHLLCACLAQEALKLRCFGPLAEDADVHQTWPGTSAYDTPRLYRDLEFALVRDVLGRCNNMKHQVGWEHFGGLWITFVFLRFPAMFTSSSGVTCFRCACYTGSDWHLLPAPRDSLSFENYWDLSKNLTSHLQLPTQSFLQLLLSTVIKAFTHHILLLHFVTGGVWWITLIILSLQVTQTQHNVSTMVTTEL